MQWRIQQRGPGEAALPLFLDQTEARRAEKNIWGRGGGGGGGLKKYFSPPPPPPPPPSLSEGLDPATVMGYVTLLLSF